MAKRTGKTFTAVVRRNVRVARARADAVFKQSVQDVVRIANTPTAQGGRMRVDTSFLRNSVCANLNSPASGPSVKGTDPMGNADDVSLVIAGATVKDVIWVGWSAEYAQYREYQDGFLEGATKQWNKIVNANVQRAKREIQ